MNILGIVKGFGRTARNCVGAGAGVVTGTLITVGSAQAALPVAVDTALTDGAADGILLAGGVLGLIIGIAIFKYMRRGM